MSDDRVAVVLLVLAVGCLVCIAIGLAGSIVVSGREADAERDPEERWR